MLLVDDDCVQSNLVPCTASLSGACIASLMDGVTRTMAQLGCWPSWPPRDLECVKHLPNFRIVSLAETDVAYPPLSLYVRELHGELRHMSIVVVSLTLCESL